MQLILSLLETAKYFADENHYMRFSTNLLYPARPGIRSRFVQL
jgi:hypothetical protein